MSDFEWLKQAAKGRRDEMASGDTPTERPCRLCKQPIVAITDPPQVPPHPLRPSGVDDTRHMQCPTTQPTARPELSPLPPDTIHTLHLMMDAAETTAHQKTAIRRLLDCRLQLVWRVDDLEKELDAQRAALAAANAENARLSIVIQKLARGAANDWLQSEELKRAEAAEAALERTEAEREALREALERAALEIDEHKQEVIEASASAVCRGNELKKMDDAAEMLWIVVANASGGNWSEQSPDWQEAAARWRDNYYATLAARASATPATREGQ
jgi:hypothetical protein